MTRAILAATVLVAGCRPAADQGEQPPVTNNAATQRPTLPIAEPPLDRAALLQAAARAASAAALRQDDRRAQGELEGDRFELRIRFGCPGVAPADASAGPFSVRFEPETRTLRLSAAPDLTLEEPWIGELAGEGVEAVEGFWMHRPWLLAPGCPAPPAPPPASADEQPERPQAQAERTPPEADTPDSAAAAPPSGQRVGIAQFFTDADPRTGRRDRRGYEATSVLPEGQQPSPQGYDLVLSGRLKRLAVGGVIACRVQNVDVPPDCVIGAEFDRVRIERPGSGEVLAEWGGG